MQLQVSLQLGYSFDHKQVDKTFFDVNDNTWHKVEIKRYRKVAKVYLDGLLTLKLRIIVSKSVVHFVLLVRYFCRCNFFKLLM